jgi:hypothetical protein
MKSRRIKSDCAARKKRNTSIPLSGSATAANQMVKAIKIALIIKVASTVR